MTNSFMLRQKIKSKGIRLSHLVNALHTSYAWLKKKIDGKKPFTNDEIFILGKTLNLNDDEIIAIFFADDVDNMTTDKKGGPHD